MNNILLFIIFEFHVVHDSIVIMSFLSSASVTLISLHLDQSLERREACSGRWPSPSLPGKSSDEQSHTSLSLQTFLPL